MIGAILALVGVAALYTFVLHELVPPSVPDTVLLIVEGAMADRSSRRKLAAILSADVVGYSV